MKTLKFILLVFAITAFTCGNNIWGQKLVHEVITVTVTSLDYDDYAPGIGTVSGTYKYHFTYRLNKAGFIEAIHWNAFGFNLYNERGEKVIVTDAGHDNYGVLYIWFNTPDLMNGYDPRIDYDCVEGRLDPLLPPEFDEGVAVEMGCKVLCKGVMLKLSFLAILHVNANGVTTVDVVKP